jgi:hypothetical protein
VALGYASGRSKSSWFWLTSLAAASKLKLRTRGKFRHESAYIREAGSGAIAGVVPNDAALEDITCVYWKKSGAAGPMRPQEVAMTLMA